MSTTFDLLADRFHPRGSDEDCSYRLVTECRHGERFLEGVHLPTEGIASNGDIYAPEAMLIGPPVEHRRGEQDHAGTGAVHG